MSKKKEKKIEKILREKTREYAKKCLTSVSIWQGIKFLKETDLEYIINEMEELEHSIIATKGKEYTQKSQDRARNFNRAADDLNISPLKVCWIYLKKQLDGILNYVIDEKIYSGESIEQRVADAVNYLHFIIYIIRQREKK